MLSPQAEQRDLNKKLKDYAAYEAQRQLEAQSTESAKLLESARRSIESTMLKARQVLLRHFSEEEIELAVQKQLMTLLSTQSEKHRVAQARYLEITGTLNKNRWLHSLQVSQTQLIETHGERHLKLRREPQTQGVLYQDKNELHLIDINGNALRSPINYSEIFDHEDSVFSDLGLSDNGRFFAVSRTDKALFGLSKKHQTTIWDTQSGNIICVLDTNRKPDALSISHDRQTLSYVEHDESGYAKQVLINLRKATEEYAQKRKPVAPAELGSQIIESYKYERKSSKYIQRYPLPSYSPDGTILTTFSTSQSGQPGQSGSCIIQFRNAQNMQIIAQYDTSQSPISVLATRGELSWSDGGSRAGIVLSDCGSPNKSCVLVFDKTAGSIALSPVLEMPLESISFFPDSNPYYSFMALERSTIKHSGTTFWGLHAFKKDLSTHIPVTGPAGSSWATQIFFSNTSTDGNGIEILFHDDFKGLVKATLEPSIPLN